MIKTQRGKNSILREEVIPNVTISHKTTPKAQLKKKIQKMTIKFLVSVVNVECIFALVWCLVILNYSWVVTTELSRPSSLTLISAFDDNLLKESRARKLKYF